MAEAASPDRLTAPRRSRPAAPFEPAPLTVAFVGSGRAATSLARGLRRSEASLLIADGTDSARRLAGRAGARLVGRTEALLTADVTLLAVPDLQIEPAARELADLIGGGKARRVTARVIAHLSGSQGLEVLDPLAKLGFIPAAIHPLQVLSGWRIPPGTTFAVEAAPEARALLSQLVASLGGVQLELPAGARRAYHAAAVIAANLSMALLAESADLLESAGIDRQRGLEGLLSLLRGGLEASLDRGLPAALTGPVTRGDTETLRRHIEVLRTDPELLNAYRAVSRLLLRQSLRDGRPDPQSATAVARLLEEDI